MTPIEIVIAVPIVLAGLVVSVDRWAHLFPGFRRWLTRRFPRVANALITPDDEEQPWLR
jgi:hypothetical protein